MNTISIRVTDSELRKIELEKKEASAQYRVSRHALIKRAISKGLELMKEERGKRL